MRRENMPKKPHKFYTPNPKVQKTIRIDADVLLWVDDEAQKKGIGYQTHLNALLRDLMLSGKTVESRLARLETAVFKKAI